MMHGVMLKQASVGVRKTCRKFVACKKVSHSLRLRVGLFLKDAIDRSAKGSA